MLHCPCELVQRHHLPSSIDIYSKGLVSVLDDPAGSITSLLYRLMNHIMSHEGKYSGKGNHSRVALDGSDDEMVLFAVPA